jgi:hypothetical protein
MASPSTQPATTEPKEHPALAMLRLAPLDDEPDTDTELAASEQARRDFAEGRTISDAQLCADLGISP